MKSRVLTFVAAAAFVLGGCAVPTDSVVGESTPASTQEATTAVPTALPSSEPVTEEPTVTEEPVQDTTAIGKTLTYESKLAVRVVSAKVFNPGSSAYGLTAGHKAVKVVWTITNGTDATVDLQFAEARLTYGADGTQAEQIYAEGVGGQYPFEGSLQPGKKKTAASAFSVPTAGLSSITIEVEPDSDSQTAFFTGKAASK